ncbi:hypothetical protein BH09BAC5_BH09BAC5_03170 [soil metagenome]
MKLRNLSFLAVLLMLMTSFKSDHLDSGILDYPKPEGVENLLFYVQRTINSNTIVYTLNEDSDGKLNEAEPIKAYWIKYAEGGKVVPLTYVQKTYAYGVESQLLNKERQSYVFEFVSYRKKIFYLLKSAIDNKYHVYGAVNNKMTMLNNILVRIEGGTFWVPNVKSVEVKAIDQVTKAEVTEIIKP